MATERNDSRDWVEDMRHENGKDGVWHRGGATVYDWTWYGFAKQELMRRFIKRYRRLIAETDDE